MTLKHVPPRISQVFRTNRAVTLGRNVTPTEALEMAYDSWGFPGFYFAVDFWDEAFWRKFWYQHDLPSKLNCCFIVGDSSLLSPSEIAISSLQLPMKLPKPSWKNFIYFTLQNTHFGSSKIPEKKNLQILLFQPQTSGQITAHVSGFPDGRRLQGRIQHLKGRIVPYGVCLGEGGILLKTWVGLKKTPSWTNHRCTVGCWDSMISCNIYICLSTIYSYLMIWRDFQDGCTGYLPLFHQNSCQISSFFPARIPRFPAIFPVKPGLFGELGAKVQLTGKCRFWLSEMLGRKASRTQNGGTIAYKAVLGDGGSLT